MEITFSLTVLCSRTFTSLGFEAQNNYKNEKYNRHHIMSKPNDFNEVVVSFAPPII